MVQAGTVRVRAPVSAGRGKMGSGSATGAASTMEKQTRAHAKLEI